MKEQPIPEAKEGSPSVPKEVGHSVEKPKFDSDQATIHLEGSHDLGHNALQRCSRKRGQKSSSQS